MMPRGLYRFVQVLLACRSAQAKHIVLAEWLPNVASGKRACSHLAEWPEAPARDCERMFLSTHR